MAYSQEKPVPPIAGEAKASDKKSDPATTIQEIPITPPSSLNLNVGGKLDIKGEATKQRTNDESSKWTDPITWLTFVIALANILLWLKTCDLVTGAIAASKIAKAAADAARDSADAAVRSAIPILSPVVVVDNSVLHPLSIQTEPFESHIDLCFQNLGKTPAMVVGLRFDIVLNAGGSFTPIEQWDLKPVQYSPIIGPNDAQTPQGVADLRKPISLNNAEFTELLAEAASGAHRRFDLVGEVVYDDFFGKRFTRRFCIRLRYFGGGKHFYQGMRGGHEYNRIEQTKTPVNESPFRVDEI